MRIDSRLIAEGHDGRRVSPFPGGAGPAVGRLEPVAWG